MQHLIDIAQAACDAALKAGADCADVSVREGASRSVDLEVGEVKNSEVSISSGISVRAFSRGACGWASATRMELPDARSAGEDAAALAKSADPDPDFIDLPEGGAETEVPGLYDEAVAGLSLDDLLAYLKPEVAAVRAKAPEAIIGGGCGAGHGTSVYVSSKGHVVTKRGSSVSCSISVAVRDGDDVGAYHDWEFARTLDRFDPAGIGDASVDEALKMLGSRPGPSAQLPLVFGFDASRGALSSLIGAVSAEEVQRGRSFMAGMEGQRVASEALTLTDSPFIPGGAASAATDGEGVPHKVLTLVDEGVLTTYLHNSYTAGKAGVENTAHSTRGGIAPTNVIPTLGDRSQAELIADIDEGIFVRGGHVAVNNATGDFSQVVDFGYKIEKGELAYPLKETMISGSYLDLLRSLDAVSSDYREKPGLIMPALRVSGVRVIAR
jgi:PmbA protein